MRKPVHVMCEQQRRMYMYTSHLQTWHWAHFDLSPCRVEVLVHALHIGEMFLVAKGLSKSHRSIVGRWIKFLKPHYARPLPVPTGALGKTTMFFFLQTKTRVRSTGRHYRQMRRKNIFGTKKLHLAKTNGERKFFSKNIGT